MFGQEALLSRSVLTSISASVMVSGGRGIQVRPAWRGAWREGEGSKRGIGRRKVRRPDMAQFGPLLILHFPSPPGGLN